MTESGRVLVEARLTRTHVTPGSVDAVRVGRTRHTRRRCALVNVHVTSAAFPASRAVARAADVVTGDGVLCVALAKTAAVRAEGAGRAHWDNNGKKCMARYYFT